MANLNVTVFDMGLSRQKLGQGIRKKLHTRRVHLGGKHHNTSSRGRKIETLKPLTPEEDASLQSVWETKNVDEFFVNCLKDQDAFMSERSLASIVDHSAKRQRYVRALFSAPQGKHSNDHGALFGTTD